MTRARKGGILVKPDWNDITNKPNDLGSDMVTYETLDENGDIGTGSDQVAKGDHNHNGTYEPPITKNTAFNKNFGTNAGEVCQANDTRLSDSREWNAEIVARSEAEAGVGTTPKKWTAERVAQAIAALGGGGGTTYSGASVTHSAYTYSGYIYFDTEQWDTDNYHDITTNSSRLTAPSNGYYLITLNGSASFTATTVTFTMYVRKNGTIIRTIAESEDEAWPTNASLTINYSFAMYLAEGDYLELYCSSGFHFNGNEAAGRNLLFQIQKLA